MGTVVELEPAWELKADDNVWSVGISRDGRLVVIGSWDNSAYGVDHSGKKVWQHKTADYVKGVGVSNDGDLVAVGSYDRYIYAIKGSGKLAWRYKTENYVRTAAVSADGEYVAAGSWRGTLYFLDKRGKLLWKQRIGSALLDLAVSADGGTVVVGCEDGSVHAFDIAGVPKWVYRAAGAVTDVAVSSKGDRVLVCAKDTVMTCLTAKGEPIWRFHIGGISKGLCLVQRDELAVVFTDNNFIQYVDGRGELMFMRRLPEEIWEGAVAEDGITVAVATKDNRALMFEISELGGVVLEMTQQSIERVVADGVDVAKAQEMHRRAGDLLADGKAGEAILTALEAVAHSQQMRSSYLGDQATTVINEVEEIVAGRPDLDMRKAIRFLSKARVSMQQDMIATRLDRALFYARLALEAAEASVASKAPMVEDELFQASLGTPVDTDESEVNRLLGIQEEPRTEPLPLPELEEAPTAETAGAPPIDQTAQRQAELAEEVAGAIQIQSTEPIGAVPPAEAGPTGREAEAAEVAEMAEAEVPEEVAAEAQQSPIPGSQYVTPSDVCPECGEDVGKINDRCRRCYSKELMTVAVEQAKKAHKDGLDIGALAPDLKQVKTAWQGRDFDGVIALSERILVQLESITGVSLKPDAGNDGDAMRKKKKMKKVK